MENTPKEPYLQRHLQLSDRLLDCIDRALDHPRELYTTVVRKKTTKTDEEEVYGCERDCIDDKKLLNIVAAFSDLKDIQRQTLGILEEKDRQRFAYDRERAGLGSENALQSFLSALNGEGAQPDEAQPEP